jgi:hypothetical protein
MRHGSQGRRPRNKGHHGGGGQHNGARRGTYNRNQIFDSNGPEVRIRGTAHQVCEKYLALAKDAAASGDSILAESYLQHAEHYQRIINTWNEESRDFARPNEAYTPADGNQVEVQGDDLSLPISILGGDVKAKSEDLEGVQSYESEHMLETA